VRSKAKALTGWLYRVEAAWPSLRVESVEDSVLEVDLGGQVKLSARIFLDSLTPDDVVVESMMGRVGANGELTDPAATPMQAREQSSPGSHLFQCVVQPKARSGLYGYAIRVLPRHPSALSSFLPGLILWAGHLPS
jgi:glycogen phosphorylase